MPEIAAALSHGAIAAAPMSYEAGENMLFLMRRGGNNLFVALQVPATAG